MSWALCHGLGVGVRKHLVSINYRTSACVDRSEFSVAYWGWLDGRHLGFGFRRLEDKCMGRLITFLCGSLGVTRGFVSMMSSAAHPRWPLHGHHLGFGFRRLNDKRLCRFIRFFCGLLGVTTGRFLLMISSAAHPRWTKVIVHSLNFTASSRISKGQGYQGFIRKRAGSSFGQKRAICIVQGKTWRTDRISLLLGSIKCFFP
jgi:hypothetical protein